jgi:hypothetical protein
MNGTVLVMKCRLIRDTTTQLIYPSHQKLKAFGLPFYAFASNS